MYCAALPHMSDGFKHSLVYLFLWQGGGLHRIYLADILFFLGLPSVNILRAFILSHARVDTGSVWDIV